MWRAKHLKLAGVEMEGGWIERPDIIKGDGSVTVIANHVGEVAPGPFSVSTIPKYIARYYPDVINPSCGFHIHISTKCTARYTVLMRDEYNKKFLETFDEWARHQEEPMNVFRSRLEGRNRYCKKKFIPLSQFNERNRHYDRYTQLNYCWGRHKTLECRLFPMFHLQDTAISAYRTFVEMTDAYISDNLAKEQDPIILDEEFDSSDELLQVA